MVRQYVEWLDNRRKNDKVIKYIYQMEGQTVLFVDENTRRKVVETMRDELKKKDICAKIMMPEDHHNNAATLAEFKEACVSSPDLNHDPDSIRVLITTDAMMKPVVHVGDLENIRHVVSFDFPRSIQDYKYRTALITDSRLGLGTVFFMEHDWWASADLVDYLYESDSHGYNYVPVWLKEQAIDVRKCYGQDYSKYQYNSLAPSAQEGDGALGVQGDNDFVTGDPGYTVITKHKRFVRAASHPRLTGKEQKIPNWDHFPSKDNTNSDKSATGLGAVAEEAPVASDSTIDDPFADFFPTQQQDNYKVEAKTALSKKLKQSLRQIDQLMQKKNRGERLTSSEIGKVQAKDQLIRDLKVKFGETWVSQW